MIVNLSHLRRAGTVAMIAGLAALTGCDVVIGDSMRGWISDKPPIHPVLDMDFQQKVKAQSSSELFADGRGMRLPVDGTVAHGSLADEKMVTYRVGEEDYVDTNPLPASMEVVQRGQERFNIHCAVCHDRSGSGNGLVLQRAKRVSPAAFNYMLPDLGKEPRLQEAKDGYLYKVITEGQGTMPAYGHQVPVEDRWAIVHYLRVLQKRFTN